MLSVKGTDRYESIQRVDKWILELEFGGVADDRTKPSLRPRVEADCAIRFRSETARLDDHVDGQAKCTFLFIEQVDELKGSGGIAFEQRDLGFRRKVVTGRSRVRWLARQGRRGP
jgi:hypothetical protein